MDLFVYGTLQDDRLVSRLTGRRFRKQPAVLPGYRKVLPPGGYPYIVRGVGARVEGFVLCDVDAPALRLFDRYEDEGRLYHRANVVVSLGGQPKPVMTYVGIATGPAPSGTSGTENRA